MRLRFPPARRGGAQGPGEAGGVASISRAVCVATLTLPRHIARRVLAPPPLAGERSDRRAVVAILTLRRPIRSPCRNAKQRQGSNAMSFVLAIDQGTTSSRAIVFRSRHLRSPRPRSRNSRSIFRPPGWVEHEPEDIWTSTVMACRDALEKARRSRPRTSPRSASPTSARPRWCGTAPPAQADAPRHRLAGPPHRRRLRQTEERRPRARDHGQDRPDHRSLFLGHQGRMDPRSRCPVPANAPSAAN